MPELGLSGGDVISMLTDEEVSCMRDTFGEELLSRIKDLRITTRLATDPDSRFIFECINQVSINRIGLALMTVEAGLSEDTASCIFEVIANTPDPFDLQTGRIAGGLDLESVHLLEAQPTAVRCLNDEEALATFAQMNVVLDQADTLRGSDVLAMLNPSELACVRQHVDAEVLNKIEDHTVMESFRTASEIFGCIENDSLAGIFIAVSDSRMGGLSESTLTCAGQALKEALERDPHPHLIEFALGLTGQAPEHYGEAVTLSRQMFACMSDDELIKLQKAIADAVHQG